ncbi:UNVERIFIED_CONTAM: protein phosphatase 2C and cyclic nucleotide-binding/kinase domain-containing protein [Sesamum latifolium]|uniref:protein-serine/threonine phosphatase n=1 Tax=Sesamum latifolium TaxID=2727402 RepID=A0AAW2VCT2_9LAMI
MGCVYSRTCIGELCAPRNVQVNESGDVKTTTSEIAVFSPAKSDSEEGENGDQLYQLSSITDPEVGITRLSRVSAQFLPPDGSKVVKVPSESYELRYSFLSQRGYYPDALDKANQDSFCIHTPFGTSLDDHFFGVFDGHGEFGAQCSQFVKQKLCENLLRHNRFHMDAVEACHVAFLTTNAQLHADELDDSMSGTTAITVLVRGRTLYVANSGDSRAVLAEKRGQDIIEGLKNPDVQCWGTEEGDDGDPPRLWVQNGMYPGTAFTRSIGDSIAETIGVVANPEIVVLELTQNHPFFVIASDGVFEFLSSQSVVDMAAFGQSENFDAVLRPPLPQVIEVSGSESPSLPNWRSRHNRARNDLSRARLRAIESSLENGQAWVPSSPANRKTWEEEGGEGDCFYVVGNGEFEVLATQIRYQTCLSVMDRIVDKNENLQGLYVIQKGVVKITCDLDSIGNVNASSLMSEVEKQDDNMSSKNFSVEKTKGDYFGEWTLLGEHISSISAIAVGNVVCSVLTKEKLDSVVGPLAKLAQDDHKSKHCPTSLPTESIEDFDTSTIKKIRLADLEWRACLYSTDCSEIILVRLIDSETLLSLKRFSKQKVKRLGKESLVLKEKNLFKSISQSAFVPRVICTCADQSYAGLLLDTRIACSMTSVIHSALDETSAQFCAACIIIALEDLHKSGILYRGVSPDVLVFDQTGYIQLVDFRFGKKLSGDCSERTYTICGTTDSLAPEIIQGKGHGFPADWWALGALIYFMLQGEMPFGSWRESELTFARIVKGQLTLPQHFSIEAVDLITKLLEVDESARLGSQGIDSVKAHPWFDGIDWKGLAERAVPAPHDIISRIKVHLDSHSADIVTSTHSPVRDIEELNTPEWLEDW